ncbi:MAG TPA: aminopeptidase, partial [Ohtaekwangia sp.]|nr:aminopeptidase [Ohtaekwangia sp.]
MRLIKAGSLVLSFVFSSCGNSEQKDTSAMKLDPHSYARPTEARVKHLSWKATVNFNSRTIDATATWEIEHDGADTIYLDTKALSIKSVSLNNKESTPYRLGPDDQI